MFRLYRTGRKSKVIAQAPYVGISSYQIKGYDEGVCIQFRKTDESDADYTLIIPYDKIDSVVQRLVDSRDRRMRSMKRETE